MLELIAGIVIGVFVPDVYKAPIRGFMGKLYARGLSLFTKDKVTPMPISESSYYKTFNPDGSGKPDNAVNADKPVNPLLGASYMESAILNPVDPGTVTDGQIMEYLEQIGMARTQLNIDNHRKDMALAWEQANTESVP